MKNLIREIHRRSLWQVLGIYLAVSWIVLQVVDVVGNNFGLPDWVAPAALVLLLLGLPVVIATAFVQEGMTTKERVAPPARSPAEEAVDAAPPPAPAPRASQRWLTWRNAALGGLGAFALLGVLAVGWLVTRSMGVGPAATLVAAGVLDERDRIIVSEFGTRSGDTILAETATEALRVDLTQSRIVTIAEPRFLASALERMQRPPDTRLDRATAMEVAVREGIKAIVAGELNAAGGGYVLTAEVVASATDETLVSQRVVAKSEDDLLEAIDELSRRLRERVGESLRATRADPPLERATTSSLEALRLFSQATRAIDVDNESVRGIALLGQAIELDSTFALAWRKMGTEQRNIGYPISVWGPALTKAFELRDRLADRERYLATASYYGYLTGEPDRALTAYESMLELDPNDHYALNNGAIALNQLGEFGRAEEYALRAIDIAPDNRFPYFVGVAAEVLQGKLEEARATYEALTDALPDIASVDILGGDLALAEGDVEGARTFYASDLERRRGVPEARAAGSWRLADLAFLQGRLGEAERLVADFGSAREEFGDPRGRLLGAIRLGLADLSIRQDPEKALSRLDEALGAVPLDGLPVVDRPYERLISLYALAGRPDRAAALQAEYEAEFPAELVDEEASRRNAGLIALARGRRDEAIALLLQAESGRCTRRCSELAIGYDASGNRDSAVALLERYVTTPYYPTVPGRVDDTSHRAAFYERLGQLYDGRGDLEDAAKYYAMFVDLWAGADEELQPRVRAAQARLEEIQREIG